MRKVLIVFLALGLVGCASTLQKVQTVWTVVTTAQVSSDKIALAATAFDAIKENAATYLTYCKTHKDQAPCAYSIRKKVVQDFDSGTAARNQLESYIVAGGAGPADLYNTMVSALNSLTIEIPAVGGK